MNARSPSRSSADRNGRAAGRTIDRRSLLLSGAALVAGQACTSRQSPAAVARPPGVPVGPFGAESTADEVVAGLDLGGIRVLVTGATSGLGFETARVLASHGAAVVVAGRTLERAAAACRRMAPGRTEPLALELEDWPGLRAAAAHVTADGRGLDVLICNAGVMAPRELRLVHGVEQQFAVNHLAHFILSQHLLPALTAAPQGRVVVVASNAMGFAPPAGIDFDNLDGSRGYEPLAMYGQSKLANALFAFALADRLRATRVTVNVLHPGVILTNLDRAGSALGRLRARLMAWSNPRLKSIAAGSATQVYLATAPALARVSGQYFEDCNPVVPDEPRLADSALRARLWTTSESLTRPYLP